MRPSAGAAAGYGDRPVAQRKWRPLQARILALWLQAASNKAR